VCICDEAVCIRRKLVCICREVVRITQAQGFGECAEGGGLGQPGREVAGLVLPGFAQRHALELAQGLGGRHGSGGLKFIQLDLPGEKAGEEEVAGAAEVLE
jgi:hypothetical protein